MHCGGGPSRAIASKCNHKCFDVTCSNVLEVENVLHVHVHVAP